MPLPKYKSHKTVEAFKITSIIQRAQDSDETKVAVLASDPGGEICAVDVDQAYLDKHNPQIGGYYVRYPDGYESFSPADAFEDGYVLLTENE